MRDLAESLSLATYLIQITKITREHVFDYAKISGPTGPLVYRNRPSAYNCLADESASCWPCCYLYDL